jgi:hypothetical protein
MPKIALISPDGSIRNAVGRKICQDKFDEQQLFHSMEQEIRNSLGFEIDITTLTEIKRRVVEQKFYEIPFADYVPVVVGEGAFATNLLTYREFSTADDFESGNINMGANNSRLAEADTAIDSVDVKIINWAKSIGYTLFELQQAAKSGNWSIVEAKERARYKNWQLGLQRLAFLGSKTDPNVLGLLTQPDVTVNTTLITKSISSMSVDEFQTLIKSLLSEYQANCNYTRMPDKFIIPNSDYLGLGTFVNPEFPVLTKIQALEDTFKKLTGKPDFKILPLVYAQQDKNSDVTGLGKNRYTMLTHDIDSIRMDIPLDYTTTIQDTTNGFQWQSAAYGQYTGTKAYRPQEVFYCDNTTSST